MKTLLCLILLVSLNAVAQNDTIFLNEINVVKQQKVKFLEFKSKGANVSFGNNLVDGFFSRYDKVPSGILSSITLYFNDGLINLVNKNLNRNAVRFKLLINSANPDGSLGPELNVEKFIFAITDKHKGSISLNLDPLLISTSDAMYFGVETIEEVKSGSFAIMMERNSETKTYIKTNNGDQWFAMPDGFQIKLKAKIRK